MVYAWTDKYTIKMAYEEICQGEEPWVALGNLTNSFFGDYRYKQVALLEERISEPAQADADLHRWAVFCAASVIYLCHRYNLSCPQWASSYPALDEQWFFSPMALKKSRVRERYEQETPEEFKAKNIFCGDKVFQDKKEEAEKAREILTVA